MPINYIFKDSKTADTVAKALLIVAKFSKKQALVKFSEQSVSIIWGGSPKAYFIHVEAGSANMFKDRQHFRPYGIDHCTIIQIDPLSLGRLLKANGAQDRNLSICVIRPNKLRLIVESADAGMRTIVHTLPCEIKTLDDYKAMLIEENERNVCRYDTKSYVENIHRFKHIIESFVKLNTQRVYIWSRSSNCGNDLTIQTRTPGSNVHVSLSDLENGFAEEEDSLYPRRDEAGVNIDTKKLSCFLSSLVAHKNSKTTFEIEHNKCLKITLDSEAEKKDRPNTVGDKDKFYQSLLLLHSLNQNY